MKRYFSPSHPELKLTLMLNGRLISVKFSNGFLETEDKKTQELLEAHQAFKGAYFPSPVLESTPVVKKAPKKKGKKMDLKEVKKALEESAVEDFLA